MKKEINFTYAAFIAKCKQCANCEAISEKQCHQAWRETEGGEWTKCGPFPWNNPKAHLEDIVGLCKDCRPTDDLAGKKVTSSAQNAQSIAVKKDPPEPTITQEHTKEEKIEHCITLLDSLEAELLRLFTSNTAVPWLIKQRDERTKLIIAKRRALARLEEEELAKLNSSEGKGNDE